MAQGTITARLTDMMIDLVNSRVTFNVSRFIEDVGAAITTIEGIIVQQTYVPATLAAMTAAQIKADGVALAKAANARLPGVVN